MRFTKMHGLGNDYIYIDGTSEDLSDVSLSALSKLVSDRHLGVGSDGLIVILPSERADFRMRIFNPDGSEAEMCGNGVRCFAKYVYEHGLTTKQALEIETGGGIVRTELYVDGGRVRKVRVDMGPPRLAPDEIPVIASQTGPLIEEEFALPDGRVFRGTCVSMGNPHCVFFVESVDGFPVQEVGPLIENHSRFPRRTNVEFAQVVDGSTIRMRVWERGETMACGTGACATAVAGVLTARTGRRATVKLLGGDLEIEWADDNHVYMTGPAAEVCTGTISQELLEQLD
ncbi:MAG: diaminopimelate epimerase [Armatimonadetes bacterium]|nr:diaminopimelate epimerase [Armatimonadota bacterium]